MRLTGRLSCIRSKLQSGLISSIEARLVADRVLCNQQAHRDKEVPVLSVQHCASLAAAFISASAAWMTELSRCRLGTHKPK